MKILLCCDQPWISRRFGASRVTMDLFDTLKAAGAHVDFYPSRDNICSRDEYHEVLAQHLKDVVTDYDVIDFPYHVNSWIQKDLTYTKTLKVTRVALLWHQQQFLSMPSEYNGLTSKIRKIAKKLFLRGAPKVDLNKIYHNMDSNLHNSDIITVANSADVNVLKRLGHSAAKVELLPYGLTRSCFKQFEDLLREKRARHPIIAFVGTFDFRKGCLDFPYIVKKIATSHPNFKFRLLGTRGMYQTADRVLKQFPKSLHKHIEIIETFAPEELPELLGECYCGLFPSYWEGFGIAVIEMLAAGLPTVAYDAPGPCDILPPEWLVPTGDKPALTGKLVEFIESTQIDQLRSLATAQSRRFDWDEISQNTLEVYSQGLEQLRKI